MDNELRLERLRHLLDAVQLFKGSRGKPVRLDGHERRFNMWTWDCGSAACAAGAYKLTPYGMRQAKGIDHEELAEEHFGLSIDEGQYLFAPDEYFTSPEERSRAMDEEWSIPPYKVERRIVSMIHKYAAGRGDMQQDDDD